VPTPTSIPSVASQDTGVLTGDYRYKVTYVNSAFVEGDIGPTNATFTAASATMRVDLPVAPVSFGVNYRYLYRTETSGSTWKRVTMVTNNTATTYDDNKPDADLGIAATVDIIEMPKYDAILFHPGVGRMFMTDTDNRRYIWYTEANEPYTVKASNFIPIGDFGGDLARGFGIMQNSLLVMADKRPYIIYFPDNDPANWQVIPCKTNYGSSSPFGVVEYGNGIICTALDNKIFQGFQHIVGDTNRPDTSYLTYATIGSDLITDNIEPSMLEVESGYLRNISAITYKNKVYYTVTVNNKTYNNKIFVLDVSPTDIKKAYNASITGMDSYVWLPWAGINVSQFTVYNNKLYGGCSEGLGIVLQLNTDDYTDNDIAINSYWITKQFYGFIHESENHKDFRQMFCLADTIDDTYLGVAAKCDSDVGIFTMDAINIDTNANYWGGMVWGQDTWNAGIYQKDITYELGTLNGKRVQFKFSNLNRDNKHFKLHYMSFSYNVKGRR
jgi:hypothetical protein